MHKPERAINAMSEEAAVAEVAEVAEDIKKLGDSISELSLKQAKELSDYLKDAYGIEPASGGAVMVAASADGGADDEPEQTEFDVVLTGFGEKKLNVVKLVKAMTGSTLMESKKLVEACPATLKEKADKEEAEKMKAELEEAGASVELK